MGELPLQIEKIAGLPGPKSACGVFSKRITLYDGNLATIASLFFITSNQERDLQILLGDLFEITGRKLEESTEGILSTLRIAGDSAGEYASKNKIEVAFAHLFFLQQVCYFVKAGEGVKIIIFEPSKSVELTFADGSGPTKSGQIYLLATEKLFSTFDQSVLLSRETLDFEGVIDGLATEISANDGQSEMAAAFVLVKGESEGIQKPSEPNAIIAADQLPDKDKATTEPLDLEAIEEDQAASIVKSSQFKNRLSRLVARIFSEIRSLRRGETSVISRLRRNIVILVLVILLVLGASALFAVKERGDKEKLAQFNLHLQTASSKYKEGTAIIDLNRGRAREILIEADREIKLALAIDEDSEEAKNLSSQILTTLRETEEEANVAFETFVETSGEIASIANRAGKLVAAAGGEILEIDVALKKQEKITTEDQALQIFSYGDYVFILAGDKLLRVDLAKDKKEEVAGATGAHDMAVFLGNIYLLFESQIAKMVPTETGYVPASDYLASPTNFGGNSRFAIDGFVWVTNGREILKFLRGEKQTFEISGQTAGLGELGAIYTSSNFDNLYVVDRVNSALLEIDKEGVYKKAYQSREFGRASDLVIADDEGKMYLAVGNKILEAPLR